MGVKAYLPIIIILAVALVNGFLYLTIVPPWQHYDEPNHFEYAWLIANRRSIPQEGDYDPAMRREVAGSMLKHGFFDGLGFLPDLDRQDQPVWIGAYSQFDDPPLYYLLVALPLGFFALADPYSTIDYQLYAARLVSLVLYLISIFISWGIIKEITPPGNPLRWLVPLCIALLPAYTDIMTAVNNDTAAVVFFSLFLWGMVRLLNRGFSLWGSFWVVGAAALCYWTKNTTWMVFTLFGLLIGYAVYDILKRKSIPASHPAAPGRQINRYVRYALLGAGLLVLVLFSLFSWGDASYWHRKTPQDAHTRTPSPDAPLGEHALRLDLISGTLYAETVSLQQLLPPQVGRQLWGKKITLGAWIWADKPAAIRSPILHLRNEQDMLFNVIDVSQTPGFYQFEYRVPEGDGRIWLSLSPLTGLVEQDLIVYYDGIVLVDGSMSAGEPAFLGVEGQNGVWGNQLFTNLMRNASAEGVWPRFRPWFEKLGSKLAPYGYSPSTLLYSFLDEAVIRSYYWNVIQTLLRSFWAKFGWGHVPLYGHRPYRLIGLFTLVALVGIPIYFVRHWRSLPRKELTFLGIALLGVWLMTFVRGSFYLFWKPLLPVARYAYPAVVPTMLFLILGWIAWMPARFSKYGRIGILTGFLILDIYAVVSIWIYYRS